MCATFPGGGRGATIWGGATMFGRLASCLSPVAATGAEADVAQVIRTADGVHAAAVAAVGTGCRLAVPLWLHCREASRCCCTLRRLRHCRCHHHGRHLRQQMHRTLAVVKGHPIITCQKHRAASCLMCCGLHASSLLCIAVVGMFQASLHSTPHKL